jgi:predicted nucleic acid-binding protein
MATTPPSRPPAVVIDANVVIAVCAKEAGTYLNALAQMRQYVQDGWEVYAPGVMVAEALFGLCRQQQNGIVSSSQHQRAIQRLLISLTAIQPPPKGDAALVERAEQIRGSYGCSHSADGLYIALAEELAQAGPAELVTFDAGLRSHAAAAALTVTVRLLTSLP